MNFLLCKFIPKSWVSRTKTLLKRRKIATKSRPISAKKLKQQQKLFNYAHEYKALQVQKQLDRRTYASQHINQLIDQIFYPDVTQAHEEAARLHIESSTLKEHNLQLDHNPELNQINERILATELIEYYNNNNDKFEGEHVVALFKKLAEYFRKKDKIKNDVLRKWNKMNETMKKNQKNYQEKKCPYLFIDREDTFHYTPWNTMITDLCSKFEGIQPTEEGFIDNMFLVAQLVQLINSAVYYVPFKIYEIFDKFLFELKAEHLDQFTVDDCHNLVKSISLKNTVRYPAYHTIPSPEDQQKFTSTVRQVKMTIVLKFLSSPEISSAHISDTIKLLKTGGLLFTQELAQRLKQAVLRNSNLVQLQFQKVVDLLYIFVKATPTINPTLTTSTIITQVNDNQFMELIKFDILRKSPNATNINYLFKCMQLIWNKHLQPRPNPNEPSPSTTHKLYGNDLLLQCANTLLAKYTTTINNNKATTSMLNAKQTQQLINIFYRNNVDDVNLLEFVSGEIIKNRDGLELGEVTDVVLKVFLLGYRSPVLVRVLFDEQKKRYHETKKRILSQDIQLLQGKSDPTNINQTFAEHQKIPLQQLHLQQDLIISLWLLFLVNTPNKKLPIPLDELLTIYPTTCESKHPLIYQFCLNLNQYTRTNSILFKIRCQMPVQRNSSKIRNRLDVYYECEQNNIVVRLMKMEAIESYEFERNYHRGQNKFISQPWSQANTYSPEAYLKYLAENKSDYNYFNKQKLVSEEVKKLRGQVMEKYQRKKVINSNKSEDKSKDRNNVEGEKIYKID